MLLFLNPTANIRRSHHILSDPSKQWFININSWKIINKLCIWWTHACLFKNIKHIWSWTCAFIFNKKIFFFKKREKRNHYVSLGCKQATVLSMRCRSSKQLELLAHPIHRILVSMEIPTTMEYGGLGGIGLTQLLWWFRWS